MDLENADWKGYLLSMDNLFSEVNPLDTIFIQIMIGLHFVTGSSWVNIDIENQKQQKFQPLSQDLCSFP